MITPNVVSGKQPKISVWLDDSNDKELKLFKCPVCGKGVFEYASRVKIIAPGESSFQKAPLVVQCHGTISVKKNGEYITARCKAKFFIE